MNNRTFWTLIVLVLHCFIYSCIADPYSDYMKKREDLIALDFSYHFDSKTPLSQLEEKAGNILDSLKNWEVNNFVEFFPPEHNFRDARQFIDSNSKLFPIIKEMPKGGILHIHSIADGQFVFQNATYRDDCYIALEDAEWFINGSFIFSANGPPPFGKWANVQQLRQKSGNSKAFDEQLFGTLQFYTPENVTEDEMWDIFDDALFKLITLHSYKPVFKSVMMDGLQKLVDDNVQYVEIRGIPSFYDSDWNLVNAADAVQYWLEMVQEFNNKSAKPIQVKFIQSIDRKDNATTVYDTLVDTVQLRRNYSEYVIGYDLVDEEDRYNTLLYYIKDFLMIQQYIQQNGFEPLPYYFHAGETDWDNRFNLYDAILLNTTRIGHGYALKDYPELMKIVKEKKIALEVCPISNQMLKLLGDLRNHPAAVYLNHGLPVTISPDDPVVYGYSGVSYDYYLSYISWNLTIQGLKQLTNNSIQYSGMSAAEKAQAFTYWQDQWNKWVQWIVDKFDSDDKWEILINN